MNRFEMLSAALHVHWARLRHIAGWHGLLGMALIAGGLALQWQTRDLRQDAHRLEASTPRPLNNAPTAATSPEHPSASPRLPSSSDTPSLLRNIRKTTQANGLAWTSATYQFIPLTGERLATLEIQTTLKGPYLQIKKVISTLLRDQPAMAMREFIVTRPTPDAEEVEARIRWAVFLSDGWTPTATGAVTP